MNFFVWLTRKTCYTFTVTLVSVLGGQVASLYGYFCFYSYFYIHGDRSILNILPNTMWYALIALLTFVSMTHYCCFGLFRAFGFQLEYKKIRIINDHVQDGQIEENLPKKKLTQLFEALSRFPLLNTLTAGILGFFLLAVLLGIVILHSANFEHMFMGLRAGLVALLVYLYITYVITEFMTTPQRSQAKKAIYQRGEALQETHLFSLKGKFASFMVFMLITLVIINNFNFSSHEIPLDRVIPAVFTILSIAICGFLVALYFTSIFRSIEEARIASEDLASGGSGYVFSGSLDKEFIQLNRSMIAAAQEVNEYRTKMENLVREKTMALEKSLEDLNESEMRFRSMVENGSDIITILNADGTRSYVSPSIERILGYKTEKLIGKSSFEFIHPDDIQRIADAYIEGIQTPGAILSMEYRIRHKDGSWIHMESVGKNFLNDSAVAGVVINSRDITERKKAEEKLRESEEIFRLISEQSLFGILIIQEGRVLYLNDKAIGISGYPREEILSWGIEEYVKIIHPDDLKRIVEAERNQRTKKRDGTIVHLVHRILTKRGEEKWVEQYSRSIPYKGKHASLSFMLDITDRRRIDDELRKYQHQLEELVEERTAKLQVEIEERRRVEEEIRRLNQELEQRVKERTADLESACEELKELDKLKDSFLSSVSHELRTPLTSIRSFSEILLKYQDEDKESQKEFVNIINSESERLTRLINDVLDLARIEAGRMDWKDNLVSLQDIIIDAAKVQHQLLEEKSLQLTLDLDSDLPSVFADRDRIQQVITNLLSNAIKFSHQGGKICIRGEVLEGKESTQWIKISISDQGLGIEEKNYDLIFSKFHQVSDDALEDKPKGTGLGLPICKEIIMHYHGNIWVESRKGEGCTFYFTLPASSMCGQSAGRNLMPRTRRKAE